MISSRAEAQALNFGLNGAPCTFPKLQLALAAAAPGDTIYVRPNTYNVLPAAGPDGVFLDQDVTLAAGNATCGSAGPGQVTYRANATRVFTIGANRSVMLRNLRLEGGTATNGGAVKVGVDALLTIDGVLFDGGVATQSGGCLWLDGASLQTVGKSSVFANCLAGDDGGAIFGAECGSVNLPISTVFISDEAGEDGGAIRLDACDSFSASDLIIDACHAGRDGGAVALTSVPSFDLGGFSTSITNNSASVRGGAIFVGTDTTVNIAVSSFSDNEAVKGGAIAAVGNSTVAVANSQLVENFAAIGGGIWLADAATASLSGAFQFGDYAPVAIGNRAAIAGGTVYAEGASHFAVEGAQLIGECAGNCAQEGGILWLGDAASASISGTFAWLKSGSAVRGGNVYSESSGELVIDGANTAPFPQQGGELRAGVAAYGGNMYLAGGHVLGVNSPVFRSGVASVAGGSIYATGGSTVDLQGDTMLLEAVPVLGQIWPTGSGTEPASGVQIEGDAPAGGAIWAADSAITGTNIMVYESDHALFLSQGGTLDAFNMWLWDNALDTVTVSDLGSRFTVGSDFARCPSRVDGRDAIENEYCSAIADNVDGAQIVAGDGTVVGLTAVGVMRNHGVSGRPVALDISGTGWVDLNTCLFYSNVVDVPVGSQSLANIPSTGVANLDFVSLADDDLPFVFATGAGGHFDSSIAWPAQGTPGDSPLVVGGSLAGTCSMGQWSGVLSFATSGTDPVYFDPLDALFPNFRLATFLSPAVNLCADPMSVDLDGEDRADPAASAPNDKAEPGAFEIHL